MSKLVKAFKQQNKIEDKEVSLQFDGEELSPAEMIENTELNDLDVIDVVVK